MESWSGCVVELTSGHWDDIFYTLDEDFEGRGLAVADPLSGPLEQCYE